VQKNLDDIMAGSFAIWQAKTILAAILWSGRVVSPRPSWCGLTLTHLPMAIISV